MSMSPGRARALSVRAWGDACVTYPQREAGAFFDRVRGFVVGDGRVVVAQHGVEEAEAMVDGAAVVGGVARDRLQTVGWPPSPTAARPRPVGHRDMRPPRRGRTESRHWTRREGSGRGRRLRSLRGPG